MGQEIGESRFSVSDFAEFERRLAMETELLEAWLGDRAFSVSPPMGGFELEAWLVDAEARPAGVNERFLARLDDPLVVSELARFNVELNGAPQRLEGDALTRLHGSLHALMGRCQQVAGELACRIAMVGILPTARNTDFSLASMSPLQRYAALNEQVLRLRRGSPVVVDIKGVNRLRMTHHDVMLEAAATSFQVHLKVDAAHAARYCNASKILSAPMVAVAANSPFLFDHDLWAETRVPLFEQSVSVGGTDHVQRVTFGLGYVGESILECFTANRDRFPVLLPHLMDEPPESLAHLRLHNGTIWRWNRPLIGFDSDGTPHLRIEHRVVPSGPTVSDSIANAALYFGAVQALACRETPPEGELAFEVARHNFYEAARQGLDARVTWLDGTRMSMRELCLEEILPLAGRGLAELGISESEIGDWLGVVEGRLVSGQNGAIWQRRFLARYGPDFRRLVEAYLERQLTDLPVHEWTL